MDTIIIEGLTIECIIGCLAWERDVKQKVILDLALDTDITQAAKTDDVKDCLNYDLLCQELTTFIQESRFHLMETLAETIAARIFKGYPACAALRLTVNKPAAVGNAKQVGLSIARSR